MRSVLRVCVCVCVYSCICICICVCDFFSKLHSLRVMSVSFLSQLFGPLVELFFGAPGNVQQQLFARQIRSLLARQGRGRPAHENSHLRFVAVLFLLLVEVPPVLDREAVPAERMVPQHQRVGADPHRGSESHVPPRWLLLLLGSLVACGGGACLGRQRRRRQRRVQRGQGRGRVERGGGGRERIVSSHSSKLVVAVVVVVVAVVAAVVVEAGRRRCFIFLYHHREIRPGVRLRVERPLDHNRFHRAGWRGRRRRRWVGPKKGEFCEGRRCGIDHCDCCYRYCSNVRSVIFKSYFFL